MNFNQTISDYIEHLGHRGYSPRTIEAHGEHLRKFASFIERFYPRITTFETVTKDIAEDYQRYIADLKNDRGQVISNATKNKKLGPVRKLFSWLVEQDRMISNPAKTLVYMKEDQRLVRNVLTEEETRTILSSIQTRTPVGLRNRAIFELLYASGIRTSELCDLRTEDVDLKEQTVLVVRGKGGKSREKPSASDRPVCEPLHRAISQSREKIHVSKRAGGSGELVSLESRTSVQSVNAQLNRTRHNPKVRRHR